MKELLDKLSSYNLFNYLLPGTLFVATAQRISARTFRQDNIVIELFVYYFIGLVVSRLGSLILEPLARKTGFVSFSPYPDFVAACSVDPKIEILSEQNNMFRTLTALIVALALFKAGDLAMTAWRLPPTAGWAVGGVGLFVLFGFAYRKQTGYITKRVSTRLNK